MDKQDKSIVCPYWITSIFDLILCIHYFAPLNQWKRWITPHVNTEVFNTHLDFKIFKLCMKFSNYFKKHAYLIFLQGGQKS
jgi:hypothetical protein